MGDLDTADNATWLVPGMGTTVKNNISGYVRAAHNLASEQYLTTLDKNTAVVAWLGYKAPGADDVIHEATDTDAAKGGGRLADAIDQFDETRSVTGAVPRVSVVAHSYGTLVATEALTKTHADSLLLEGSAGIPTSFATSAADLNVPAGQVFATQATHDGLAIVGQNTYLNGLDPRIDPTSAQFGAHDLSSEADGALRGVTQHGPLVNGESHPDSYSYWDNDTQSLLNAARVTTGSGASLPVGGTPQERIAADPAPVDGGALVNQLLHGAL